MKWIALVGYLGLIPLLVMWMRSRPRDAGLIYGFVGFLPFIAQGLHLTIAPYGWPQWAGFTRGFEISLIDSFVVAILIARPPNWRGLPFLGIFAFYIFANVLSSAFSAYPTPSLFAGWQAFRTALLFAAIASACTDPRAPRAILAGMIIGVITNAGVAFEQRFFGGLLQAPGLFSHQNVAGMATHFVTFPIFAALLSRRARFLDLAGLTAVAIVVLLGASRAGMGLAALGVAAVIVVSLLRHANPRTIGIAALGCVALAAAFPIATAALNDRFENSASTVRGLAYDDERLAFERAAKAMWSDHPMGVGANAYVAAANMQGYSERSGVNWSFGNRAARVHNGYLMAGAEMGYPGFLAFIALLAWPVVFAFRTGMRYRRDPRGDVVIGIGASVFVVAIHSFVEWVFVTSSIQWLFAICLGIMAGLTAQMKQSEVMAARNRAAVRARQAGEFQPA